MLVSELLSALKIVSPAISSNGINPVYSAYQFKDGTVSAYDGSVLITVKCNLPTKFNALIPHKPFFDIIKSLSQDKEISLSLDATGRLVSLVCGTTKMDITTVNSDFYAIAEDNYQKESADLFSDFVEAVKQCYPIASKDSSSIYHNLYIDNGYVYSTDKYRCMRSENTLDLDNFILPNRVAKMIVDYGKIFGYSIAENSIKIVFDNFVLVSSLIVSDAPNNFSKMVSLFFDTFDEGVETFKFEKCAGVFKRHSLVQENVSNANQDTELKFVSEERAVLTTNNPNIGSIEDTLELSMPVNNTFSIFVNPRHLYDYVDDSSYMAFKEKCVIDMGSAVVELPYLMLLYKNGQYVFPVIMGA